MIPSSWIILIAMINMEAFISTNPSTKRLLTSINIYKILLRWLFFMQFLWIVSILCTLSTLADFKLSSCIFLCQFHLTLKVFQFFEDRKICFYMKWSNLAFDEMCKDFWPCKTFLHVIFWSSFHVFVFTCISTKIFFLIFWF